MCATKKNEKPSNGQRKMYLEGKEGARKKGGGGRPKNSLSKLKQKYAQMTMKSYAAAFTLFVDAA